jgi:putative ABC transport system permease protein
MITTLSLVLAVSFLSFVNVNTDVANGLLATGDPELRQALIRSGYDLATGRYSVPTAVPNSAGSCMLSLLVCVVGIVNAQLMAVTERFREIGTMKCLGALDRFRLRLFLLEAGMQGLVGAAASGPWAVPPSPCLNGLVFFGRQAITQLPLNALLLSLAAATAVGCLLS